MGIPIIQAIAMVITRNIKQFLTEYGHWNIENKKIFCHPPPPPPKKAMAGVNVMKTIVGSRRQPHSPLDNVNTPLNSVRLMKGAPPGIEAVSHYVSELSIEKS